MTNGSLRQIRYPVSRRALLASAIAAPVVWREATLAQHASPEASPVAQPWDAADLEEAGLTGPMTYESPLYGYRVEWTDAWQLEPEPMQPVRSYPNWGETGRDDLFLAPVDSTIDARLAFSSRADDGRTVADAMDTPLPANGGVRLLIRERRTQGTWVDLVFRGDTTEVERVEVNQVMALRGGALLFIWLHAAVEGVEHAFTTAQEILLHDDPLFATVEWEDIEEGLGRWS